MSESEEMYLVTLAMHAEVSVEAPVPVSQLASELSIQPVSANQMIRRLEEVGLVSYTPYKGAVLTPEGERLALRVLRHRRLWEVFLVEHLKIAPQEAYELACRLEHAIPSEVADRLAEFLGNPAFSPQGKTIPRLLTEIKPSPDFPLSQLKVEERGRVTQTDSDPAVRAFLVSEGIRPGITITVLGIGDGGAKLVEADGRSVYLAERLTHGIWVQMLEPNKAGPKNP